MLAVSEWYQHLDHLLGAFVASWAGVRQRDAQWYKSMGETVGGSELAAIMGRNRYSSFDDVVATKVAIRLGRSSWSGSPACWWGVLFEDILGAYVADVLGAPIRGDDISIRAIEGHRNSPDGYLVARFVRAGNEWRLWTADDPPELASAASVVLLEFKCPMSRAPTGCIPHEYVPQLWSGLAVSPIAHMGLFVEAVFRKCPLSTLGASPEYDTTYHKYDAARIAPGRWPRALAWGLIGVYAKPGADERVRAFAESVAALPQCPPSPQAGSLLAELPDAGGDGTRPPPDLGGAPPYLFNWALKLFDSGDLVVVRLRPRRSAEVVTAPRGAAPECPEHGGLVAVIPWKMLEVHYIPVARRVGFADEIKQMAAAVHQRADEIIAGGPTALDPASQLYTLDDLYGEQKNEER